MSSTPKGWMHLYSPQAGVSFDFPTLGGSVTYGFTQNVRTNQFCQETSGLTYGWGVTRNLPKLPYGYEFAGGVSRDFGAGRSGWPTDIYRWVQRDSRFMIDVCGKLSQVNHVIEVLAGPSGTTALVFNPGTFFYSAGGPLDPRRDIIAVVDFPSSRLGEFRSINFLFLHSDGLSLSDVRRVVKSVSLSRSTLPRTGSHSSRVLALAVFLIVIGVLLRVSGRVSLGLSR